MCAISGIANIRGDRNAVTIAEAMNLAQRHRGPDGSGIYSNDDVVIGHSRLAVIDLENGKQPLITDDGDLVLAVNGEIYNF